MAWAAFGSAMGSAAGNLIGDLVANNSARDNATTAYNRTRELDQWLGTNQVQWRVEDLRKAGLNPALAAGAGFGGGMTSQVAPSAQTQSGSTLGSSAMNAAVQMQQIRQMQESVRNIQADTEVKSAEADRIRRVTPDPDIFSSQIRGSTAASVASAQESLAKAANVTKAMDEIGARVANLEASTRGQNITNETQSLMQSTLVALKAVELQLSRLGVPQAQLKSAAASAGVQLLDKSGIQAPGFMDRALDWVSGKTIVESLSSWYDKLKAIDSAAHGGR